MDYVFLLNNIGLITGSFFILIIIVGVLSGIFGSAGYMGTGISLFVSSFLLLGLCHKMHEPVLYIPEKDLNEGVCFEVKRGWDISEVRFKNQTMIKEDRVKELNRDIMFYKKIGKKDKALSLIGVIGELENQLNQDKKELALIEKNAIKEIFILKEDDSMYFVGRSKDKEIKRMKSLREVFGDGKIKKIPCSFKNMPFKSA